MPFKRLKDEIDGYLARDPAATSRLVIFLTYPGLHAVLWYRLANWLWRRRLILLGRLTSNVGRLLTGVEIHPGARIGHRLVIDHGMGVVIGETAVLGDDVTLYHDVTLGGIAPSIDSAAQRNVKRHPTLEDGVIVGSGAQILGPITVHRNARVGANAVVVKDVPSGCTVVGIPAKAVLSAGCSADEFAAYGTPTDEQPDPLAQRLVMLFEQVDALRGRIGELEREVEALSGTAPHGSVRPDEVNESAMKPAE